MVLPPALRSLARRAIEPLLDHYRSVLAVTVGLAVLAGFFAVRLRLSSDLATLLPDNYDSVRTLRRAEREVGGFQTLQVLLEGDDFEALKRYAGVLAVALEKSPLVQVVDYKKNVEFFEDHALLYAKADDLENIRDKLKERIRKEKLEANPLWIDLDDDEDTSKEKGDEESEGFGFDELEKKYQATDDKRYYVDKDRRILVLNVYPDGAAGNVAFARRLHREARRVVAATPPDSIDPSIKVSYGGNFKNKIDEYEVIIDDVQSGAAVSLLAVFLLIALFFRSLRAALVIALSLVIGIAWTFGITYWLVGQLNIMTVFLFVVLFGLGIDFGIHLYARYAEERTGGRPARESLAIALRTTGSALAASAATTAVAFYSLLFADFKGFSEFGFIAGTGVLMSLASVTITLPGFILLGERIWPAGKLAFRPLLKPSTGKKGHYPRAEFLFALGCGLALIGLVCVAAVQLQYDFTTLRANPPGSREVKEKLGRIFKESNSPAIVMADGPEQLSEIEEAVRAHKEHDPTPTIDKFRSIYTALPKDQEHKLEIIGDIRALLDDDALNAVSDEDLEKLDRLRDLTDIAAVGPEDLPPYIRRVFRGKGSEHIEFAFIFPSVALRDGRNAIAFADDVRTIETADGSRYHASNTSVVVADMLLMMVREGRQAVLVTLLAVFALVAITLRSVRRTILVLIPLVVGIAWMFLAMRWLGWKLNFFNIVVIPAVVGMGIDSGIHIYLRYREEGRGGVRRALITTGAAVWLASLTTMLGFLGLALASHPGLASLGRLAILGMGLTLLATCTVLPAALQIGEHRRRAAESRREPPDA